MSLIYKSLQRVRDESASSPVVMKPRAEHKRSYSTGISRRLGVFLGAFALFSLLGFFFFSWVQGEIDRLTPRVQNSRTSTDRALKQRAEQSGNATDAVAEETAAKVAQVLAEAREKVQKSLPPLSRPSKVKLDTREKVGMEDLVKPSTDLERHFAAKARKNQLILRLEQRLRDRWRKGDAAGVRAALEELESSAGRDSALVRKWQGAVALKEKRYAEAEGVFRSVLRSAGDDLAVRINLVQVLAVQGKQQEAEQELGRMQKDFPASDKVSQLAARIRRQ